MFVSLLKGKMSVPVVLSYSPVYTVMGLVHYMLCLSAPQPLSLYRIILLSVYSLYYIVSLVLKGSFLLTRH